MPCLRSHRALAALALGAALIAMTAVAAAQPPVPGLIRFGGVIAGAAGNVTVTFSLYADQASETALWHETQTVALAAGGRYVVSLGVTQPDGLPLALFATGEARWLGVRPEGQVEQPRVLRVSVPYALKAADAETIGGKPLSAFVLAGDTTGTGADGLTYVDARVLKNGLSGVGAPPEGAGSAGYIGMFQDATTLVNSVIFQNATSIGVGTTTPEAEFHSIGSQTPGAFFDVYNDYLGALPVVLRAARGTPAAPTAVQTDDILGGLAVRGYGATHFSAGQGQVMFKAAQNWTDAAHGTYLMFTTTPLGSAFWVERMRIDPAGNVGIGTPAPTQKLSVGGTVESTTGGFKFPDGTTQTTALSLAANIFTATQTIANGDLALPATTGASSGVLTLGGQTFLHGYSATTTNPNLFLGQQAGNFSMTGAGYNVGIGVQALAANTTGFYNTATGAGALASNTTGTWNTADGTHALTANDTGSGNTATGMAALTANTGGSNNTAAGYATLNHNTSGINNTADGSSALLFNTTGSGNAALGVQSLLANTTGFQNTAMGMQAGQAVTTGSANTFIGFASGPDSSHSDIVNATAIGANAVVNQSNSLALGGQGANAVSVGIGTAVPNATLQVVGDVRIGTFGTNGCLMNAGGGVLTGTCSSDARLKTNVRPFGPVLERVVQLQPVRFDWKVKEHPEYHFGAGRNSGLIAQDVERVFPEMVATDSRGYKMVNYSELPNLTLAAVRELNAKVDAQNAALKAENDELRARIAALEKLLAEQVRK